MDTFRNQLHRYRRRRTVPVKIGPVTIGGDYPVAVQSMTNTDTNDTAACTAQIGRIYAAGGKIVRLTAPGKREAENLANIAREIHSRGVEAALVADVHFLPEVALLAAEHVDKVRINPGNYQDDGQRFKTLIDRCQTLGVAIRIGVNHGSLSKKIVSRYGDTPQGMVASAMEFLRVCRQEHFDQVVVSLKSSNTRVMVHAYRLLAEAMEREDMHYPFHLGVTEAGNGMEGRIKSAVGIGALLADGIGDTIRVSLTEAPENEIPVALALTGHFRGRENHAPLPEVAQPELYHPFEYRRRPSSPVGRLGNGQPPLAFTELDATELNAIQEGAVAVLTATNDNPVAEWRSAVLNLTAKGDCRPVMLNRIYNVADPVMLAIKAAADFGPLFLDGLADGIWIENIHPDYPVSENSMLDISLSILQAARARMSRTEYIACPSCGRTRYDIEKALAEIKQRTCHLAGLKIGVMGCIVNGPGEMADADYGFVGAAPGRITLYRGKEIVRKNIPQEEAIEALIELIREDGRWQDPL